MFNEKLSLDAQKGNSKDDIYTQLYFRFESTTLSIL